MNPRDAVSLGKQEFREWVIGASVEDVEDSLNHMSFLSKRQYWEIAQSEISRKRHKDSILPHWTTPAFWIGLLAVIFAAIAASPVILSWFQDSQVSDKSAIVQPLSQQEAQQSKTSPNEGVETEVDAPLNYKTEQDVAPN